MKQHQITSVHFKNQVPGIGDKAIKALAEDSHPENRITNTFQLIGKFLMLKGPDNAYEQVDVVDHMDKFWDFLQSKGIDAFRSGIVQCIAEKANILIPGLYNHDLYK